MNWIIEPEYIALVEIVILLIYSCMDRSAASARSRMFIVCLVFGLLSTASNVLSTYTIDHAASLSLSLNTVVNLAFFSLSVLAADLISSYVLMLIWAQSPRRQGIRWAMAVLWISWLPYLYILVMNSRYGYLFSFSESMEYVRGPFNRVPYLMMLWCVLVPLLCLIAQFRSANHALRRAMCILPLAALLLVGIQMVFPQVIMTGTATFIVLVVLHISCQQNMVGADQLTGLNNRDTFYTSLEALTRRKTHFRALFVSLRSFKNVNNRYGQRAGDRFLIAVGRELRVLCTGGTVYRFGAIEFIVVFCDMDEATYARVFNDVVARFDREWVVDDMSTRMEAAFADIAYPDHADDMNRLIESLEYGMRLAKYGDKRVVRFSEPIARQITRRNYVFNALKEAFSSNLFMLEYQPIYYFAHARVLTAEALVRMRSSTGLMIMPGEFVPLAEENGCVLALSWVVMDKACRFLASHPEAQGGISLSMNLPAEQFLEEDMVAETLALLNRHHVDPRRLKLEITERTFIGDVPRFSRIVRQLSDNGIHIYLDDFGTGYSNLAYVAQLPFECVKIDRSMLQPAMESQNAQRMLEAIVVGLKHTGARVLIEGVETIEQMRLVQHMGVDCVQGYYCSRPLTETALAAYLHDFKPPLL